jgi:hypothetical protein
VLEPTGMPKPSQWKLNLGAWGEELAGQTLRQRGYDVYSAGNRGIDRIAVKRTADGLLKDVLLVEVKVSSAAKPQLGNAKYGGRQMSPSWLDENLNKMHRSNDPAVQKLASEIRQFREASGRSIESMGEVVHINPQTGKVTLYKTDAKTIKASSSIERLLTDIQRKATSRSARDWAIRHLAKLDQIKAARMAESIGQTGLSSASRRAAKQVLARAAGPIALVIAVAMDVKEIADVEIAYRHGWLTLRERNIAHVRAIGGIAGAWKGGSIGLAAGVWVGGPVGGFVGMAIGGVGGYFTGSAVAGYAAARWYQSIESRVRERFELEWVLLPVPAS